MISKSVFDALTAELSNPIYLDIFVFLSLSLTIFTLIRTIYRVYCLPHKSETADEEISTTYQLNGEDLEL